MKAITLSFLLTMLSLCPATTVRAQDHELAALILNLEKLNQLREILQKMYDGYRTLQQGYQKVKDITSGTFTIHDLFLDGLYLVSPKVKQYYKIAQIVQTQAAIVKSYRSAFKVFQSSGAYTPDQLEYLSKVYSRLFNDSMRSLDELLLIITARQLRMSDADRIAAIDRVDADIQKQWAFLRSFNDQQKLITVQKIKEQAELETVRSLHGISR